MANHDFDVIIIGTAHRLQAGHKECTEQQQLEFAEKIKEAIEKYSIKQILEEFSPDLLSAFGVEETIASKVANELYMENHEYVDLTSSEGQARQKLFWMPRTVLKHGRSAPKKFLTTHGRAQ